MYIEPLVGRSEPPSSLAQDRDHQQGERARALPTNELARRGVRTASQGSHPWRNSACPERGTCSRVESSMSSPPKPFCSRRRFIAEVVGGQGSKTRAEPAPRICQSGAVIGVETWYGSCCSECFSQTRHRLPSHLSELVVPMACIVSNRTLILESGPKRGLLPAVRYVSCHLYVKPTTSIVARCRAVGCSKLSARVRKESDVVSSGRNFITDLPISAHEYVFAAEHRAAAVPTIRPSARGL